MKYLILPALLLLIGCSTFSTHVFRMEQTAVTVAYGGYLGYTNWLLSSLAKPDLTPERRAYLVTVSNDVKQARLQFHATVQTVESLRVSYETNSALKPPLEAALVTLINQSSNICWVMNYWRNQ